ncbi:hypothetical protein [Rhizobium ruizarguesonis]|uniref:hypothetical protein n=1 Tax=Rhizobium ruizarguesonis TaxID=2081791 RepID=UPI002E0F4846|nr:hypothetical protein U8P70_16580 [Rhizobium ruizarguesonis]
MAVRTRRNRQPVNRPLQKAWLKFTAVAAGFAVVITLLSNAGKLIDWSSSWLHYGVEQIGTVAVYPRIIRDFVARRSLERTYDGKACLDRSTPASLDEDGRANDLMVSFFYSRSGQCDDENDSRVSTSYYAYRKGGFDFVGDVSSYKYPGLTSENVGSFLIETVTETSLPEVSILQLQGNQLVLVRRFQAWVDDGDGEELIKFDYHLKGSCLEIVAAEAGSVESLCPGPAGEKNDLSFDKAFTFSGGS